MTQVNPIIDLAALDRARTPVKPPRRRLMRILIPVALLLGFGIVLLLSLGDVFSRPVTVTVVRPTLLSATATGALQAGGLVLQAAGWVEPDPFPIHVPALAPGIVREMLVLESGIVKRGDPVAQLIDDDARLAHAERLGARDRAEAERHRSAEAATIADAEFAAAVVTTEALRTAEADARGAIAMQAKRAAAITGGQSQVNITSGELEVQRFLEKSGAAGPRAVEIAAARLAEAEAALLVLKAEAAAAEADVARTAARLAAATRQFELRSDDRTRLVAAHAARDAGAAALHEAETALAQAALRLERMVVRAPADGIVLQRLAAPGSMVGAEASLALCTLFDPLHVRVRVDVPQGDVGKAHPGMDVLISTETRADRPYHGTVMRVVQQADINKVTLQVHVRILDPDALIRPEMLCQAKFLGSARADSSPVGTALTTPDRIAVPTRLLVGGHFVWVLDATLEHASRRAVEVGQAGGDMVEIRTGLNLSDKLIDEGREQLKDGSRVLLKGGG